MPAPTKKTDHATGEPQFHIVTLLMFSLCFYSTAVLYVLQVNGVVLE